MLFFAAKTPDWKEAGRLCFFAGLLVALLVTAPHVATLRIP